MRTTILTSGLTLALLPGCLGANAPERSVMPELRPATALQENAQVSRSPQFEQWLSSFRPRALAQGVSAATLDRTFRTIAYDDDAIRRDRAQAEFTRPIWQYLDGAVSDTRIENGARALREHAGLLVEIERRYGVPKEVVVAVWGLESSYGSSRGTTHVPSALATLAFDGRRGSFFESQLIGALKIIESGDVTPEGMRGSWAGAMGHTQFIPTSYLAYAVDFRGDGKRDIWSDDPTDALASTAAYLARHGWTSGQPWAVEVRMPAGFDPRAAAQRRTVGEWRALGLRPLGGAALPAQGEATLMFPAGAQGPALLAFGNFRTIKRYNNSDAYVIAVGHLSDRLRGAGPFVTAWPRTDRPLNSDERVELQRLLNARGFDTGGVDGRIGPMTIEAVRGYQVASGLTPDGYVSLDLLSRLRR
jgi:membrane-bound lytic murein transglycosylase B